MKTNKAITYCILLLSAVHLLVYFCISFPADEAQTWTEIPLCDISENNKKIVGYDVALFGCADMKKLELEGTFRPPSFTAVVPGSSFTPGLSYTGYLVGDVTLLSGAVDLSGTFSTQVFGRQYPIPSEMKVSTSTETATSSMPPRDPELRRRRHLLKGGGSSRGWSSTSSPWSRSSPYTARTNSWSIAGRRYRRGFGFSRRRRFGSRRFGSRGGTGYNTYSSSSSASDEDYMGKEEMSAPFFANVRSFHRLPGDVGIDGCEILENGCQRSFSKMERLSFTTPTIKVSSAQDLIRLDFRKLVISSLSSPSEADFVDDNDQNSAESAEESAAESAESADGSTKKLYIMFITNEANDWFSNSCFFILAYFPPLAALLTLILYSSSPSSSLISVLSSSSPPMIRSDGTIRTSLSPCPKELSDETGWPRARVVYHVVVALYLAVAMLGLTETPLILGRTVTFLLFLTTVVQILLVDDRRHKMILAAKQSAIRRHVLLPHKKPLKNVTLPFNERWTCDMEDVLSMRQLVNYFESTCLARAQVRCLTCSNNDVSSWLSEDSRRLGGIQHLNLSQNDLKACKAIASMPDLVSCDLSSNDMNTLEGFSSSSIEWLDLSNNNLTSCLGFGPLPSCEYLDLSSNDINSLAGFLTSSETTAAVLPNIQHLDLSNNNLKGGVDILRTMTTLESLNLDDNDLCDVESILKTLECLPRLKFLACFENELSDADEDRLERFCEERDIVVEI